MLFPTAVLQGVANRDLKLENLLLDRPTTGIDGDWPLLKICDFGEQAVLACHLVAYRLLDCCSRHVALVSASARYIRSIG